MIDLSNLRAPGWQRVVAELSLPVADDRAFLARLLAVLGQVSAARQAVLFAVDPGQGEVPTGPEPRPMVVWPESGPQPIVDAADEARTAARGAAESGQIRAFGLEQDTGMYDDGAKGYLIAVPVGGGPTPAPPGTAGGDQASAGAGPRGVITLLIEPRSKAALQSTLALVEVIAGYVHAHGVRQLLKRTRAAGAALELAGRLIAAVNLSPNFKGSALQLCNDLCRQLKVDRVALGWVRGVGESGAVRVHAISDTEHLDRRLAMVQKIEAAMDECLDQEQAVLYPIPPEQGPGGDVVLAQAITHAHRDLAAADARLKVASLPLRCEVDGDQRVIGVVTLESTADGPIDTATVELIQASLDLVAPLLRVRRSDDRALPARAWVSTIRSGRWLVGTRHTGWKLAGVAVLIAAILVTFVHVPYRIGAPAQIRSRVKRVIAAPYDGVIASVPAGIKAGATVNAGDLLAELNTEETRLRALEAAGQVSLAEREAEKARREGKTNEAQQAEARAQQARAQKELAEYQVRQARLTAPIAGKIIAGDLDDKIGAAVKLGDLLFIVAPLDDMAVVAEVSDRDIQRMRVGGTGRVATKSDPGKAYDVTIERIVPLAQPKEGRNAFEVWCRFVTPPEQALELDGLQGQVRLDTGNHSLLYIGTRRIIDALRMWLWW